MFNPAALFKAKAVKDTFVASHPDFPAFLRKAAKHGFGKGSVLTVRVAPPGGAPMETSLTLTEQDAQSFAALLDALGI